MKRRHLVRAAASATVLGATATLVGCASPRIDDYGRELPRLDLRSYFNGPLVAHGIFTDRSGKVVRRFTVQMQCSWKGDEGVLDEDFLYSDGSRQKRIWRLRQTGPNRYVGRADDVIGEAQGEQLGNAFHWTYTMALPVDGRIIEVQFDDWMYLIDERVMLNKAEMRKFGVRLGEVTLSFTKP